MDPDIEPLLFSSVQDQDTLNKQLKSDQPEQCRRGRVGCNGEEDGLPVYINIYDLLPKFLLSNTIGHAIGLGIYHSGVQIDQEEFAFGGHLDHSTTGIFSTPPKNVPSGCCLRESRYIGTTNKTKEEIQQILSDLATVYLGPSYHILYNNCNHFSARLADALTTENSAPAWLNRCTAVGILWTKVMSPLSKSKRPPRNQPQKTPETTQKSHEVPEDTQTAAEDPESVVEDQMVLKKRSVRRNMSVDSGIEADIDPQS